LTSSSIIFQISSTSSRNRGVRFTDGTPFVARQVATSWQRVLDPKVRGGRGWPLYPILGAKEFADGKGTSIPGIATPNDSTVVVTLKEPFAIFTKLLAMPVASIAPEKIAENFGEHPVGTGAFKFQEGVKGDHYTLVRNDHYFKKGLPYLDKIVVRIIPDDSAASAAFQRGEVDYLVFPPAADFDRLSKLSGVTQSSKGREAFASVTFLVFNLDRAALKDVRVRQAIEAAIDQGFIISSVLAGKGIATTGPISPQLKTFYSAADAKSVPHDPAKAKQLLDAAGVKSGTQMRMVTVQGLPYESFAGTIFQSALAKIGIDLKVEAPPWPQIPPQMANNASSPPMTFLNVFPNTPDPALVIRVSDHSANVPSKGGYNWANYSDPTLDSNLDKVVQIQDASQRNTLLSGMQKQIVDSASTIFCIAPDLVVPVRKEWAHVKYDPFFQDGIVRWFYWSKGS